MSIYWTPGDDEPPHVTLEVSGALARDIAALIYEHDIPCDAPTLRALVRRTWARARDPRGTLPAGSSATGRGFRPGR